MAKRLRSLKTRMDRLRKRIPKEASRAATETLMEILWDLVNHTPVDTTTALSNWQVSITGPINALLEPYAYGRFGATAHTSGNAVMKVARQILKAHKSGQIIRLSNVVDYIVLLNEGHSRQEAAFFVERAVRVGREHLKSFKLKL